MILRSVYPLVRSLMAASAVALTAYGTSHAAIVFNYTGNAFEPPLSQSLVGGRVSATVSFVDSVAGYTGVVDASSVLSRAIRLNGVAGTELNSLSNSTDVRWPLWFRFSSGAITGWQLLAHPNPTTSLPEIYTTRDTPFTNIVPTADYYIVSGTVFGQCIANPGIWSPVPEPSVVVEHAKRLAAQAQSVEDLRCAQSMLLPALLCATLEQSATALGVGRATVGRCQAKVRKRLSHSAQLDPEWGGRRRAAMRVEEERELLEL